MAMNLNSVELNLTGRIETEVKSVIKITEIINAMPYLNMACRLEILERLLDSITADDIDDLDENQKLRMAMFLIKQSGRYSQTLKI